MTQTLAVILVVASIVLHVVSDWLYLRARTRIMQRETATIRDFQQALLDHARTLREVADEMDDTTYGPPPSPSPKANTRGGKA